MTKSSWDSSKFTLEDAPYNYPPDLKLEPVHMTIRLAFDIENRIIEGSNTIRLKSNHNSASQITLNAIDFDQLTIGNPNLSWSYDGEEVNITFDEPIAIGENTEITISYKVIDPIAGLYFSYPDEAYPNRSIYVSSDHETTRARYWLPSIDHPAVRTTFDYYLTADTDYTILAIGKKIDTEVEGDQKTVHWSHSYPCPTYISAIAIGDFSEFRDRNANAGQGEIPVAYYSSSNYTPEQLELSFGQTPEFIEWFVNKFEVPMAWDKYFQFSLIRIFGAMENQSLVSWSDFAMLNEETKTEIGIIVDDINIHEMAHTYFGDMVVIQDWGHAWLKESWATYCSVLFYEDLISHEDYEYNLYTNAQRYFQEVDSKYLRPIVNRRFHSSWEMFDSHLYPGGSWRIHMLRKLLGDDTFFPAVTDYLRTYKGSTVETVDFMRKLEEHSGQSLSSFFDQWVLNAKGYPQLELSFSFDEDKQKGTFTIKQKQIAEDNDDPQHFPFKFSLDLAWFVEDSYEIETVDITNNYHQFSVPMQSKPDHVFLDLDYKVLFKLESKLNKDMYVSMLSSKNVAARIHAAEQLIDTGKKKYIDEVGNHYFEEEFWGVRKEIAKFLGKANSRFAIPHLIKLLRTENEPRLLSYLPSYAVKYLEEEMEKAILTFTNRDLPPFAQASGIRVLGKFQSENVLPVIKSYLDDDGWKYLNRAAAYDALSFTRDEQHLELLIDAVQYGAEPEYIRRSVIRALGRLGKWQSKTNRTRVREVLEGLLREGFTEIRQTVVDALIELGDKSATDKIEKIYGIHPDQDIVTFKKRLRSFKKQKSDVSEVKELTERLEKSEEKIRTLEEQIQKLQDQSINE